MNQAQPRPEVKLKRLSRARRHLERNGWSYRTAAPVLGCTYQHVCLVLCGRRESRRLLKAILQLPPASALSHAN